MEDAADTTGADKAPAQPTSEKDQVSVRIVPSEKLEIVKLAQYAHEAGYIKGPYLQQYMLFLLNLGNKLMAYVDDPNALSPEVQKFLKRVLKESG